MNKAINLLTVAILSGIFMFSSASAQKVEYDFVAGTDFSKYKTYKWQRADKALYPDEANDKLMMRVTDAVLASKGLTKVETDTADVYVIYQLAILDDVMWSSFRSDIGGWQDAGDSGAMILPGFKGATTNSSTPIKRGSLILDIYDVGQKKRVWQALATKTIDMEAPMQKREKKAQKTMAKILSNYPPAAR